MFRRKVGINIENKKEDMKIRSVLPKRVKLYSNNNLAEEERNITKVESFYSVLYTDPTALTMSIFTD